ncbi:YqcI/YcgG family protein [Halobacillus locisalis]|uniref:YqcI/YcgG family protein n=1 Tax=Halobacillus locisalis TaxID=220753 RepID=A0A838CUU0_9BACI|nr:YqcI/YcgG family protein [Halobacillus locisalis]MBA2175678.1 YqcI/YcgG family protein [Halobacillus locisalis]
MHLLTKSSIEQQASSLEPWEQSAFDYFKQMMLDRKHPYPCVPGIQGFLEDSLRYGFAGNPKSYKTAEQLASLLKAYGKISRDTGRYASIVVFFDTQDIERATSISSYQEIFWTLLSRVHELDEEPWPDDISTCPEDPSWEFCFDGEPYFAFCATPAHSERKSRHSPHFLIAMQPRWVFHDIHDGTSYGRKLKAAIRKRLEEYDERPAHPALKWYGQKDNLEWQQYFLQDDDTIPSKCPFKAMMQRNQNA